MERDASKNNRIPEYVKIILLLLLIVSAYYGRKYYIASQHPYKELDVIGTWDYGYSVTFDAEQQMVRTDKELFSLEMYTDTEIELSDDGNFRIFINDLDLTGTWSPDEHATNILRLSPAIAEMEGVIAGNEIRWDKNEDRLCIGLIKDSVPKELEELFKEDEEYRYIFCKTYRDNPQIVYRDNGDSEYDSEDDQQWHYLGIGE